MSNRAALSYSAYGYSKIPSAQTLLGFNGECIDAANGYYPLGKGYRMYAPNLMRFLSPDALSPFAEGGLNTYAYCNGDPVGKIDPTGRAAFFPSPPERLYQIINKLLFGRTPKSHRPSTTQTTRPDVNASTQGSTIESQPQIYPVVQQAARGERFFLQESRRFDHNEFHRADLTPVPAEIITERLTKLDSGKQRMDYLTVTYRLEPLNRSDISDSTQYYPGEFGSALRQA